MRPLMDRTVEIPSSRSWGTDQANAERRPSLRRPAAACGIRLQALLPASFPTIQTSSGGWGWTRCALLRSTRHGSNVSISPPSTDISLLATWPANAASSTRPEVEATSRSIGSHRRPAHGRRHSTRSWRPTTCSTNNDHCSMTLRVGWATIRFLQRRQHAFRSLVQVNCYLSHGGVGSASTGTTTCHRDPHLGTQVLGCSGHRTRATH